MWEGAINERTEKMNLEGDKFFIRELVDGLDKAKMREVKSLAFKIMTEQNVHESVMPMLYRNAYRDIAIRRLYRKEIEAYTKIKILGDYISIETMRWVVLPRGD